MIGSYQPSRRRPALAALRTGRVSIVTDRIDRFTASGLRLACGRELKAESSSAPPAWSCLRWAASG